MFSEWIQKLWLMFVKGDLIKIHLLNTQVVCSCFETKFSFYSELRVLRLTLPLPSDPDQIAIQEDCFFKEVEILDDVQNQR